MASRKLRSSHSKRRYGLSRVGSIYLLTNKINGKKYVGQTINKPELRWYFHIYAATRKVDSPLARAIKKYGCHNFTAEVIHTCEQAELDKAEQRFIYDYDCMTPAGYNLTSGGTGGRTVSLATRKKISKKLKGRTFSEETHAKFSAAQYARFAENPVVWKPESKLKLSLRNKGKTPSRACLDAAAVANKTRVRSQSELDKISKAMKARKLSKEHRERIGAAQRGVPKSLESIAKGIETRKRRLAEQL